ncbi:MAG: PQQ-dependent sugar dehydrogenase [Egibacteraceae bacterium]
MVRSQAMFRGVLVLTLLTLVACVGHRSGPGRVVPPVATPSPTAVTPQAQLRLTRLGTFEQPLVLAVQRDDPALYVGEKGGRVRALRGGRVDPAPSLDLSDQVSTGSEQGLLGLAFSPDGRHVYVNYTNRSGDTRIVEFAMDGGSADPASRRELLAVDQPYANHNGGNLVFGPDGMLYVGLGDGGSGGDPQGNAQRLDTLLGKLLRLNPRPQGERPYGIPAGNPFVGRAGARPEIWAYGLRNPWRFSFDRQTGDLWIGDVGQNAWEEIDFVPSGSRGGENYGWNHLEGTHPFQGSAPAGAVAPVHDYPLRDGNCAVTGGFVYRGSRIPALQGVYSYGDFCAGHILGLRRDGGRFVHQNLDLTVDGLSSFGQDHDGELYAMSLSDGGLYRIDPVEGTP